MQPSLLIDIPLLTEPEVQRVDESRRLTMNRGAVRIDPLTNRNTVSEMSVFLATIDGERVVGNVPGHRGEEFCYVLEGFLEVNVDGKSFVLSPGDSIHFKANRPHQIRNVSKQPARTFWAVRPKLFI